MKIDEADIDKLTLELELEGWEFLPFGPNEWGWFKFDSDGNLIGRAGDEAWIEMWERVNEAT